jgi:VWFA-related protein
MNTAVALSIALALSLGIAVQQRPLFRGGVDLVEVDAVATGRDGKIVRGLSRDDFEVREDGQPVAIKAFTAIDADRASADADGRMVVLLLDNVLTDAVWTTHLKTIAHDFATHMGPHDVAGVALLNGSASKTTTSRAAIDAAIEAFHYDASKIIPTSVMKKHALDMIHDLARALAPVKHRRKMLVCIGAAALFTPTESTGIGIAEHAPEWTDALAEASRANVAVYVIPPGLGGTRPEDAMSFAEATGGIAFNTNELAAAVDKMWDEAGHYYLIGYEAPATRKQKAHSIDVRAKAPGVSVRARKQR